MIGFNNYFVPNPIRVDLSPEVAGAANIKTIFGLIHSQLPFLGCDRMRERAARAEKTRLCCPGLDLLLLLQRDRILFIIVFMRNVYIFNVMVVVQW